jgi:2-polyprenyl-3-methyl-5-hydroxy-6-metoxy-1,4-benzoquinol methylase
MKKIKCPLCNSSKFRILYRSTLTKSDFDPKVIQANLKNTLDDYRKHGQIVKCTECNLVYTNPMEDTKSLLRGYKEVVDTEYLKTETYRKYLSSHHLAVVRKFKKKGDILDIGCFAGFFLELAKQKKWKTFGIEPSKWASTIARKRGIKIIGQDITTAKIKKESFDAVTMWDVIEHLPNPQEVIKIIHKILKKDGIVAFGTPNIESLLAKTLRERYPYLIRMHILLYSPKTLKKLFEENGFKVIHVSSYGRTYPLAYILDRIKSKNIIFLNFKKIILSYKRLAQLTIHLNLRDEFVMIAKKV